MPIVRFLTPAATPAAPPRSGHAGLDAFADALQHLGYAYQPYYAGGNGHLDTRAHSRCA